MSSRLKNQIIQNNSKATDNGIIKDKDFMNVPEHALPKINHKNKRGRTQEAFPTKLFKVLQHSDTGGYSSIISWLPHGRAFKIHNIDLFKKEIMTKYFFQTRLQSFTHQLYMYGFETVGEGRPKKYVYYHALFLRERFDLCKHIPTRHDKYAPTFIMPSISHEDDFYKLPDYREMEDSKVVAVTKDDDISPLLDSSVPKVVKYKVVSQDESN